MINVEMAKDIQDFSPKVIAFLNRRQLICLAVGCAYALPIGLNAPLLIGGGDSEWTTRITLIVILLMPAIACGWVRMYGMPLEIFLIQCVMPMMLRPGKRLYHTETAMDRFDPDPAITFEQAMTAAAETEKKKSRRQKKEELEKRKRYQGISADRRTA